MIKADEELWLLKSIHYASSLGALFTIFGLLGIVAALIAPYAGSITAAEMCAGTVLAPGLCYSVALFFLNKRQRWAWRLVFVTALLQLALAMGLALILFFAVERARHPPIWVPLSAGVVLLFLLAVILRMVQCLLRCRAIFSLSLSERRGFPAITRGKDSE